MSDSSVRVSTVTSKGAVHDFLAPSMVMLHSEELRQLKETLACHEHPDLWCWVDPQKPDAYHIPLALNDIQLWAQYIVRKFFSCYSYAVSNVQTVYPSD